MRMSSTQHTRVCVNMQMQSAGLDNNNSGADLPFAWGQGVHIDIIAARNTS